MVQLNRILTTPRNINEHFGHEKVKTTNRDVAAGKIIQAVHKNMSQFTWSCQSLVGLFLLQPSPPMNSKAKFKETYYCSKKKGEVSQLVGTNSASAITSLIAHYFLTVSS